MGPRRGSPSRAVENGVVHIDGDKSNVGLDQPAGQKTALAKGRPTIFVSDPVVFLGKVERVAGVPECE